MTDTLDTRTDRAGVEVPRHISIERVEIDRLVILCHRGVDRLLGLRGDVRKTVHQVALLHDLTTHRLGCVDSFRCHVRCLGILLLGQQDTCLDASRRSLGIVVDVVGLVAC